MRSIEVYGFVGWISSYVLFIFYLLWAFLPEQIFQSLGIYYLPSKYWAMAIPCLVVFAFFILILAYLNLNIYVSSSCTSINTIEDKYSRFLNLKKTELHEGLPEVYDLPAPVANNVIYYQPSVLKKYR